MNITNLPSGNTPPPKEKAMPSSLPLPINIYKPWHLVVLLLDNIDDVEKAHIPLKEVDSFLRLHSRFWLKITFIHFNDAHNYTVYPDGNGFRYDLHWTALPDKWIRQIPPCSAVLSLYKLNGRPPVHAGSTWALAGGIPINGKLRTYAAIPTDLWFYNNEPYEGFKSRAAQIQTHEIINTIQGKIEAAPYFCSPLTGTPGDPASKYEADRLSKIGAKCYEAIGQNED